MAGNKWLEQHDEQVRAKERAHGQAKLTAMIEMDLIAYLLTVNDLYKVGPSRADVALETYEDNRLKIARAMVQEIKEDDDQDFPVLQRDLAVRIKQMFGDNWKNYTKYFPMLKDSWDLI